MPAADERRPERFAAFVRDEVARWDKIIREARIPYSDWLQQPFGERARRMDGNTGKPAPVEAAEMRAIARDQRVAGHARGRCKDGSVFFG